MLADGEKKVEEETDTRRSSLYEAVIPTDADSRHCEH